MRSDENNIDDFFRSKYNEFEADTSRKTTHWQHMVHLLNGKMPGLPKSATSKRITRRIITYMGVAAVVTTIVYFSIINKRSVVTGETAKKESGKKLSISIAKNNVSTIVKLSGKKTVSNKYHPSSAKPALNKPSGSFNKNSIVLKKIGEASDTVFLKMPAPHSSINSAVIIKGFYDRIRQPVQFFTIDPTRDTLLFGYNGTVIKIPAYAFADNENKIIKTAIIFELTECYSYADILAYDLATTSGNEQLVTGGMLRIHANADGKELKLLSYRPLNIAMPMEQYDPEMQLFTAAPIKRTGIVRNEISGADDKATAANLKNSNAPVPVDWQPADQQQAYRNPTRYFEKKTIKLFELRQIITAGTEKYNTHFLIKANDIIPDDKIKELIRMKYLSHFDKLTIERVKNFSQEVNAKNTNVLITKTGFVAADSVCMDFQQALKEKLLSKQDSLDFAIQLTRARQLYAEKIRNDSIAYVKQKEFDKKYYFDISGLGWINCDKFYKSDQPTVKFTINIGNDIDQVQGNYKLVFTNIKSVLRGSFENGKVNFGEIPVNEPVQVVCVSQRNGKALVCIKSMKVNENAIATLRFEEMTEAVFKEKLSRL